MKTKSLFFAVCMISAFTAFSAGETISKDGVKQNSSSNENPDPNKIGDEDMTDDMDIIILNGGGSTVATTSLANFNSGNYSIGNNPSGVYVIVTKNNKTGNTSSNQQYIRR